MEETATKTYDILLYTPIGKRTGELKAKIGNGKLIGFLSLFGNSEPIEGIVDENGKCFFSGKFITLMKTVEFIAEGVIDPSTLCLAVKSDCNNYKIVGQLRKQGEVSY